MVRVSKTGSEIHWYQDAFEDRAAGATGQVSAAARMEPPERPLGGRNK